MNAVPIRDGKDALAANWLEVEIADPKGKITQRFSFIADLPVGRGKQTLAFALRTGCDPVETAWQKARERFRARTQVFTHLATTTQYHLFRSWSALMRTLTTGVPPPQPP